MVYGTKYQFTWESQNGADCSILIQKDGYSGSIATRNLGRAPVLKRKNSGRVYGTSLEIYAECSVDQEFSELYTPNAREYKVLLQRGNTTIWTGFVSPELYAEPDIAPPYDVQIVATDGLGELKQYTFESQGDKSLGQLFSYLISFSGGTGNINRISYLQGKTSAGGTLSEYNLWNTALINIDYKAGETCYDVLQYLLDTLCASITFHNNAWLIWRDNEISPTNSAPVSIGNIGNAGVWPIGQLSTKVEPAKKKIIVEAPFHPWTPLVNPDMDRDAAWIKNTYVSYDTTRRGYKFYCPQNTSMASDVVGSLWQSISNITILQDLILSFSLGNVYTDGELDLNISFIVSGQAILKLYWNYNENTLVWATSAPANTTRMYYKVADGGETITIPRIPSTLSAYQVAGTLKIEFAYIPRAYSFGQFGYEFYIYSAHLNREASRGFRDILNINNGARGEGNTVEIAQGRVTSGMASVYYGYLRGVLTYGGDKFVTSFIDSHFSTYSDFLALTARNYARLVALPLLRITGKVNTPASFAIPMLMAKDGIYYLLKTCSWDMKNDELEIDALALPSGNLTIESEQVIDTTGESAPSGGVSGGGTGGTTVNWGNEGADHYAPLSVAGDERSVALSGHTHNMDDIAEGSIYKKVSQTEKNTWSGKQDALTFDDTPTANSSNPVKSGGIKTALDGKANSTHSHSISQVSGLQDALNGKSDVGHTHAWDELTSRPSAGDKGLPVFAHPGGKETDPKTGVQTTIKQGQPYPIDHIGTHPELAKPVIVPLLSNDFAYLRTRGGACTVKVNNTLNPAYDVDTMFDNTPASMQFSGSRVIGGQTYQLGLTSKDAVVLVTITTPGMTDGINTFTLNSRVCYQHRSEWGSRFFIDFGNDWWGADWVQVTVKYGYWYYDSNNNNQLVVVEPNTGTTGAGARQTFTFSNPSTWSGGTMTKQGGLAFVACPFSSNGGYGIVEIDVTLTGFHPDTSESSAYKFKPRISEVGLINLNTPGPGGPLMSRGVDNPVFRDITPGKNNAYALGSSIYKWLKFYAQSGYMDNVRAAASDGIIRLYAGTAGNTLVAQFAESYFQSYVSMLPGANNLALGSSGAFWNLLYVKRIWLSASVYVEVDAYGIAHLYGATGFVVENGDVASAGPSQS